MFQLRSHGSHAACPCALPCPATLLQSRIEQAEAGGCPEGLVGEAKLQLHRLLLAEVAGELDAALKLSRTADKSVVQRLSSLKVGTAWPGQTGMQQRRRGAWQRCQAGLGFEPAAPCSALVAANSGGMAV